MPAVGKDWFTTAGTLLAAVALTIVVERLTRRSRKTRGGSGRITALHRFPVKGLERDILTACHLKKGDCFPNDRAWGLLRREECQGFNAQSPKWIHKMKFFAACSAGEAMARLKTAYVDATDTFTVYNSRTGEMLLEAKLRDDTGCRKVEQFFSKFLSDAEGKAAEVALIRAAEGRPNQFGNTTSGIEASGDSRTVHLVNLATVRDVDRAIGEVIDPLRFRANILFDGLDPWQEFTWVGRTIAVGDDVRMKVIKRTVRCAATCVDLASATKGTDIPAQLQKHFPEHGPYLGVYAQVVRGGTIRHGDAIREVDWW
eukprot:TRINITY_DN59875_c0_g1_i1.p1 TRINITY_DN59875_c0_g1~~TRINITY_DN59875_c0_g1_i1.p1  ORF type:complete len:322 (-),score=47.21 TRINITY_DN59875_c0_g1_i1:32-973(-)